jgi:hypothetical protein
MKNKSFLILLLLAFLTSNFFSQSPNKCFNSANNPIAPSCPFDIAGYYTTTTSVVYVKLNFWITKPSSGTGVFANVTSTDASNYVAAWNTTMTNIQPPNLNRSPNPPYYWNSKIQFVLNNFQFVTDNSAYSNAPVWNTSPFNDPNAINLIWGTHPTNNGGGQANGIPSKQIFMIHSPLAASGLGNEGLILHEIGHALGLGHTWALDNFGIILPPNLNPSGLPPFPTLVDDYWFEDDSIWDHGAACGINTFNHSNNIMGYNYDCRNYLSPKQLGKMHYHLSNDMSAVVLNPSCASDNSNINITSNTVYNSPLLQVNGNITVKSGYKLTISGTVRMRENAKIIVEQGAKLIITSCGILESSCSKLWEGIEVWGDSEQDQSINGTTGLPNYQGMVDIDGGTIKDAKTGIYLAKNVSGNPDLITTGGIVHSINAKYINNKVGVAFYTYFVNSIIQDEHGNRSYFKNDRFEYNNSYKGGTSNIAFAHISGSEVANVKIYGCTFVGGNNDGFNTLTFQNPLTAYGIYGVDSRFIVRDFCSNPINPTSCNGTPIRNSFSSFATAIYLTNATTSYASTIDHAMFSNDGYYPFGQIYVNNIVGAQIINNHFDVSATNSILSPNYGLYLNICDGYNVENNIFTNGNGGPSNKTTGMYINNSGTNPNSIYNNTFSNLKQPIWITNVNFNSSNGVGLVMNCNDFSNSEYNIGVQRSGKLCGSCVNNVGVAVTQGIANTAQETDNVRNKYATPSCVTNTENKYYINTSNSFAITNHGSFNGSQWHPTPQTSASCSNATELVDVVGTNPPSNPSVKTSYCPVNYPSTFGSRLIPGSVLAAHRANKKAFSDSLTTLVDGGNTSLLLSLISNSNNNSILKTILSGKPFLSDSVMIAYFKKPNMPEQYLKEVFDKNYPVSPAVWQKITSLPLSAFTLNYMQAKQSENKLSRYNLLKAQFELVQREIGLLHHTSTQEWLNIENGPQYDSILSILSTGELPKAKFTKVGILISAKRYTLAQAAINMLRNENPEYSLFCDLQQIASSISQNPSALNTLKNNQAVKNQLLSAANQADFLTEGLAISLLAKIYDIHIAEERMEPVLQTSTNRYINEESNATAIALADNIIVYPNPAKDQLFVESNSDENSEIQITDLSGSIILTQNCLQSCTISLSALKNGVYLVNLYKQNRLISTKKIVVIK